MSSFVNENFARGQSFQEQINDIMLAIQEQGDPALANRFVYLLRLTL